MNAFFQQVVATVATSTAVIALAIWLGSHLLEARLKSYFDHLAEDYKFELRAHEQGAKIAEYAALMTSITNKSPPEKFERANQLSWELFLWLPTDVYRKLGRGIGSNESKKDLVDAMLEVRKSLLKERAGDLNNMDIVVHGPDISKPRDVPPANPSVR